MTEMASTGKVQDEPEISYTKSYSKNNIATSKEHKNQLEWDPNGQIQDNFSTKINNDSNAL